MDEKAIVPKGKNVLKQTHDTMSYLFNKVLKGSIHVDFTCIHSIHFICSGNICRSAFAEHYARKVFRNKGLKVNVSSSGLVAKQEDVVPENAIITASMYDIDLSSHKPRKTDLEMMEKSSLIAGMHYFHYQELIKRYYPLRERCYLLKHLVWPAYLFMNINDPYGRDLGAFIRTFHEIQNSIDLIGRRIELRT